MLIIPFCFLKTSPVLASIKRLPISLLPSSSRLPSQADFGVSSSCSSQHIHLFYLMINVNIAIPCGQKSFIKCLMNYRLLEILCSDLLCGCVTGSLWQPFEELKLGLVCYCSQLCSIVHIWEYACEKDLKRRFAGPKDIFSCF